MVGTIYSYCSKGFLKNKYSKGLHKSISACFLGKVYENTNTDYQGSISLDCVALNSGDNMII